jgi:hypothetical protein
MVVAVIAIDVGLSLGCWLLVWWLVKLRRQAAAIELMAIELTMLAERELPKLQLNLAKYRRQIRTTLAIYDDKIEKIDALRQLISTITWLRSIVGWQPKVKLKQVNRKKV